MTAIRRTGARKSKEELEADAFALALLMPRELVEHAIRTMALREIADFFEVPYREAQRRTAWILTGRLLD